MRKVFGLAIGLIALSGCATEIMQGYVGRSIQEPILDYGPPVNVVEMGEGRRAFQWQITDSGMIPMTSPTTASVYGSGGVTTVYAQSITYVPYSNECLYTLTATQQGDDYIVDGFRQPRLSCL